MLSDFFSSFTIYADAPEEKEEKTEEPAPEKEEESTKEEPAEEAEEEEEEPEDVRSLGSFPLLLMLNFGFRSTRP